MLGVWASVKPVMIVCVNTNSEDLLTAFFASYSVSLSTQAGQETSGFPPVMSI
jgi:hypothetical protein